MTVAYVLVYSDEVGTGEQVKAYLDNMRITAWRYSIPNCFFVVSAQSAAVLAAELRAHAPQGRFLIAEVAANSFGWLLEDDWHLLHELRLPQADEEKIRKPGMLPPALK